MYMYYLLSYRLLLGEGSKSSKKRLADNTFLLALDGDVDFYPDAVQLLVDRMKRSSHVGAACGRIHPIGSGVDALHLCTRRLCRWFLLAPSPSTLLSPKVGKITIFKNYYFEGRGGNKNSRRLFSTEDVTYIDKREGSGGLGMGECRRRKVTQCDPCLFTDVKNILPSLLPLWG